MASRHHTRGRGRTPAQPGKVLLPGVTPQWDHLCLETQVPEGGKNVPEALGRLMKWGVCGVNLGVVAHLPGASVLLESRR